MNDLPASRLESYIEEASISHCQVTGDHPGWVRVWIICISYLFTKCYLGLKESDFCVECSMICVVSLAELLHYRRSSHIPVASS